MNENFMPQVFISHAGENEREAAQICETLESAGIACWIAPRDIPPGAPWASTIVHAIDGCRAMVVVCSTYADTSKHVAREVERADRRGLPLVAVRIEKHEPSGDLGYFLSNIQWLDGLGEDASADLVGAVRQLLAGAPRRGTNFVSGRALPSAIWDEMRRVVHTWFAVVGGREKAVAEYDFSDLSAVFFAMRFLVYMQLVGLLVNLPFANLERLGAGRWIAAYLASGFVETVGFILLLHGGMKRMGGAAGIQGSLGAYSLLQAFWPLIAVMQAPVVRPLVAPLLREDFNPANFAADVDRITRALAPWNQIVLSVCTIGSTIAWVLLLVALFRSLRALHRLSFPRALSGFILGLIAAVVYMGVIGVPFAASLY